MAINPLQLTKLKGRWDIFKTQHPKFISYGKMLNKKAVEEGTIIEIKTTTPEGETFETNLKMTREDVETLRMFVK